MRIKEHKSDINRLRLSYEHWEMVCAEMIAVGHDKESYEYSLQQSRKRASIPMPSTLSTSSNGEFLLKLEGPLNPIAAVRDAADLDTDPSSFSATDTSGTRVTFVIFYGNAKDSISDKLRDSFNPTFVQNLRAGRSLPNIRISEARH